MRKKWGNGQSTSGAVKELPPGVTIKNEPEIGANPRVDVALHQLKQYNLRGKHGKRHTCLPRRGVLLVGRTVLQFGDWRIGCDVGDECALSHETSPANYKNKSADLT
jgi:hypothetical protein